MTVPPIERYGSDRKQAYVKHYFLAAYLERLVHKVGSRFDHIVYVDGFSGPWQSEGENYDDTSFGIALRALRTAKASWHKLGRDLAVKAVLVEETKSAYAALTTLQPLFPDVTIQPIHGDFRVLISEILAAIPPNAFAFVLIDPKGWSIPINQIAPLLTRPNTEIVFNFMFDFINRAASMSAPAIVRRLDELLPIGGWRAELAAIDEHPGSTSRPAARRQILLSAFRHVLRQIGGYQYVAETPVLRPHLDRMLYSLVYASRNPTGIAVFRECQIATLRQQETVRGVTKITRATEQTRQEDMFLTVQGLGPDATSEYLSLEMSEAERLLLLLAPDAGAGILWQDAWAEVLSMHAVLPAELRQMAARLKKEGRLEFPNWAPGKRVPADTYRMLRGPSA